MVGEVLDLPGKGLLGVRVLIKINVLVAVQVQRRQAVYVLAQQRLLRLVQVEDLRESQGIR